MKNAKESQYTNVKTKKMDSSEYEISATIPTEVMDTFRKQALKRMGEDVTIQGFRKGHVPEEILISHLGEDHIMEKASNMALSAIYPHIILDEKIDAIGAPNIQITKLAAGNPLEFIATTAVMPEIVLPDYKTIAKKIFAKKETFDVTDAELTETLTHIRRQRAQVEHYEKQKTVGKEIGGDHTKIKDFSEVPVDDLPKLTDEFVQTLGDFKTVGDFETKVRQNILEEKKLQAIDKKRIATVEKIIVDSTIELPNLLIEQEIGRIQAQMEADIAQTGTKIEDYLKNISKTMEDLHKDWHPEAEKRGKLQLILNFISKENNFSPNEEEVQKEIDHIKTHYPDADEKNIRVYVETTKRNEMVFKFLENQSV